MSGFASELTEVPVQKSTGAPRVHGLTGGVVDTVIDHSRQAFKQAELEGTGTDFIIRRRKRDYLQRRIDIIKHHTNKGITNPYDKSGPLTPSFFTEEDENKAWSETQEELDRLLKEGKISPSEVPLNNIQIDEEARKNKQAVDLDAYNSALQSAEHPFTVSATAFGARTLKYLDPVTNPALLLQAPIGFAIASGGGTLASVIAKEVGAALAESVIESPSRARLAKIYEEDYGLPQFTADFLANAAFGAAIPVGLEGLKRIPQTTAYRLARTRVLGARDASDALYARARAAEFAESPFNLRNDLSFSERVSRTNDAIVRFTRGFLDGKKLDSSASTFTQAEIDDLLAKNPADLSPSEARILENFQNTIKDGGDEFTTVLDDGTEAAFITRADDGGFRARTIDGEELPIRLNEDEFDAVRASGLDTGDAVRIRRATSQGVKLDQGATSSVPNAAEVPGQTVAELAGPDQAQSVRLNDSAQDLSASEASDIFRTADGAGSDIAQANSAGTMDSETLGAQPATAPLETQNKLLEQTYSPENYQSLFRLSDDVPDDFDVVLPDGSVVDAKSYRKNIEIKDRQAEAFTRCNTVESA